MTPPRPVMDSRVRARRIAVTRQVGRRRLKLVLGGLGAAALVAAAVALTRSPLLDVDRIEVVGARHTGRAAVVTAGRLGASPLMVSVDTGAVAKRVETLPWVLDARAERRWPATVRVKVTERQAVAVVAADGGHWALVDITGRVLALQSVRPPGLAALGGLGRPGPPGSNLGPAGRPALEVVAALAPDLAARVVDITTVVSGAGGSADQPGIDLSLTADGGPAGVVRLGVTTALAEKLDALRTVLEKVPLEDLAIVDLRVPRSPVLTRR